MNTFSSFYLQLWVTFLSITLCLQGIGIAQDTRPETSQKQEEGHPIGAADPSEVEFLIGISQVIERDKARLENLKNDSSRIEPVFQEKSEQFYQIDSQLDTTQSTEIAPEQLAILQQERAQLRDMLDYMLEHRRSIHQQIKILQRKIHKGQEAMDFVMKGEMSNILEITEQNVLRENTKPSLTDSVSTDSLAQDEGTTVVRTDPNQYNWRIVEAERELELRKAKFEIARKAWLLIEQLLALNKDHLAILQAMDESTDNQLARWEKTKQTLAEELATLQAADSASQLQQVMQRRIDEFRQQRAEVENALSENTSQINTLEARIDRLSSMQEHWTEVIADATNRIEQQTRRLEYLRSPLAPHRIYSFLVITGPRILIIVLFLFLLWAGGRWLTQRILRGVVRYRPGTQREERIETLSRAIRSGLTVIMLFVGFMVVMSELGIDVSVLLGGAAVFSLAIAFGAQSLVKDYFSGFMILTENQYRVGNVIKINNISGVVEDISLRTTILRDLEGVAHFIPHGQITTVSNLTHGWSRVALDVGVAYKENVDRVMEVIMEVARGMQEEEEYKRLITGEPEMLGVDAFADSAVVIKVLVKTRPTKQWIIKRELLRRLKNRFDELGIEIPFPHRTIYYGNAQEPAPVQEDHKKAGKSLR